MTHNYISLMLLSLALLGAGSLHAEDNHFTTSSFSGSGNCIQCHDGLIDHNGDDVSIVDDWSASMMANAAKDPFWKAKVATEIHRNPQLTSVINDTCSKCHAPMANYEITHNQGQDIELLGPNSILDPGHALHDAALNGVSCTLCHQIADDATLGTADGFSGEYHINDSKTIYGQYADITPNPMINNSGYTPAYSAHISASEHCASCHELTTAYVDAGGNLLTTTTETEFPEQTPYTEWLNSEFADSGNNPQSCQDCHMPHTTARIASRPRWLASKSGFARHHLVGANTTMMTLLRDNAAALDVTSDSMDLGIERARDMLQSSVTVEIVDASVSDGTLETRIRLNNNSGHKTPTSFPSRRMWLHFKVSDSNNNVLFESGRINADGSIDGADNDSDQTGFEPHYDLITSADQVQIYEPVMGDSDGAVSYTLLRAARYLKDNRLTPKGFDKASVPEKVAVWGQASNDDNFNLGSDEITYRVPVEASGQLTIQVSLNYQTIMHGFIQDLYRNSELPEVQAFKAMYQAQDLKHETITSAQAVVDNNGGNLPVPAPTVAISATPDSIEAGQSALLSWSSTDADSCSASGDWSGDQATSGSLSLSPAVTSTYHISCDGAGGSSSDSVTIAVSQPAEEPLPEVSLTASPALIRRGDSITLYWSAKDALSCSVSGDKSGPIASSGSTSVVLSAPASITLTCSNRSGSASSRVDYVARGNYWLERVYP